MTVSGGISITAACAGGQCTGACNAGFADCNNDKRTDGCETSLSADVQNCGGCGRASGGQAWLSNSSRLSAPLPSVSRRA